MNHKDLRSGRNSRSLVVLMTLSAAVITAVWVPPYPAVPARAAVDPGMTTGFVDINPDHSGRIVGQGAGIGECKAPCPGGGSGGRVNGLATVRDDPRTSYAASEVGGLFKTINGGDSWFHVDNHLPTRTWDVAVSPNGQQVYATSFYDGRVAGESQAGIQVSKNGGVEWNRASAVPPPSCAKATAERAEQPSAFGVTIRPDADNEVLIGTNCGIQRSVDSGASWTPASGAGMGKIVWDVVALTGVRAYACGEDGLLSSPDGQIWTTAGPDPHPADGKSYCVLAVSPDDPNVVFVVFASPGFDPYLTARAGEFFEGSVTFDAAGQARVAWSRIPFGDPPKVGNPPNPVPGLILDDKRNPIVVTNERSTGFDLWVGAGNLLRIQCDSQTAPSCPTRTNEEDIAKWSDTFTDAQQDPNLAHGDAGDLEFDPTKTVDACPTLFSSDGGIYRNRNSKTPRCHDDVKQFLPANVGVHAQLLHGMAGVSLPGEKNEGIYMGLFDDGLFSTSSAGAASTTSLVDLAGSHQVAAPPWNHGIGGDVNDVLADSKTVLTQEFVLRTWNANLTNMKLVPTPGVSKWSFCNAHGIAEAIAQVGPSRYIMAISPVDADALVSNCPVSKGVLFTDDITGNWSGARLGDWGGGRPASDPGPCHVQVSTGPSGPVIYALAGSCNHRGRDQLWKFVPTEPLTTQRLVVRGKWTQLAVPLARTGFSMFGADPANPDRIYAAAVGGGPPHMVRSTNGGNTWEPDDELSHLMHGRGQFVGEIRDAGDGVNASELQPTMVAFDPGDPDILIAGGRESGLFISSDAGENWALLSDPFNTSVIPHLPRPFFAHFERDVPGVTRAYIGSAGRGVWRIDLANANLSIAATDNVDPVVPGSQLTYKIDVDNKGPQLAHHVELEDVLPTGTTFKSVDTPVGWSCPPPAGPDQPLRCQALGMAPGNAVFTVVVNVEPATPSGTDLSTTARVVSASVDPDPSNNAVTEPTKVSGGKGVDGPLDGLPGGLGDKLPAKGEEDGSVRLATTLALIAAGAGALGVAVLRRRR